MEKAILATHSIGRFARATGLTISALRFYDRAGVLVPAVVDPSTGYRWYTEEQVRPARLVAALRRVGLPIADIVLVLRLGGDRPAVRRVLDRHLRRLEDGLTDARRELSRAMGLIGDEARVPVDVTVPAARLARAFDAVRFAVGTDPALPGLGGARFELGDGMLRVVATDRYRLAVAGLPAEGAAVGVTAPVELFDAARQVLDDGPEATVTLGADTFGVRAGARSVDGRPVGADFPDYRRLLHAAPAHRHTCDAALLRDAVAGGPALSVLCVDPSGELRIGDTADARLRVAFNREFLLEALDAGPEGQLVLELDGPITPLAVRRAGDTETFSILMPTRIE